MAQFGTFSLVSESIVGTAPSVFVASTVDNLLTVMTPGYANYLGGQIKQNDIIYVNYSDTSVFPLNPSPSQLLLTPNAGLVANFYKLSVNVNLSSGIVTLVPQQDNSSLFSLVTATHTALASAGAVTLITSSGSQSYVINQLFAYGIPPSINFSGGGGNRLGQVTDGTTVYSLVPAANMQALANSAWGSVELPLPASAWQGLPTAAGASLTFKYSGGSADYALGQIVLGVQYKRVA